MTVLPMVAIVGQPNVGKSTLFNRIIQQRRAIVQHTPGVTRDRIHAPAQWQGRDFILVDTGGLMPGKDLDPFTQAINRQVDAALAEADVIIFVVDGQQGLLPLDAELARQLHRLGKPVLLAVNKIDHPSHYGNLQEFYTLGLGEPLALSAEHGTGTGDLLDQVVDLLPVPEQMDTGHDADSPAVRVAVLGRPNVGKSSLLNKLLGQDRFIVSPVAGTTRDAADVRWQGPEGELIFVDTAGLRRRSRVREPIEYYSTLRAMAAMRRADVALLVLDAQEKISEQDKTIAAEIDQAGRAAIIVVNKWDLAPPETTPESAEELIYTHMPFLTYAPIIFLSALTGRRVHQLPSLINSVARRHKTVLPTPALNQALAEAFFANQPRTFKGRRLKLRYATQTSQAPPTFLLFVNDPRLAEPAFMRYLERRLREAFDLTGTPIRLNLRRSST